MIGPEDFRLFLGNPYWLVQIGRDQIDPNWKELISPIYHHLMVHHIVYFQSLVVHLGYKKFVHVYVDHFVHIEADLVHTDHPVHTDHLDLGLVGIHFLDYLVPNLGYLDRRVEGDLVPDPVVPIPDHHLVPGPVVPIPDLGLVLGVVVVGHFHFEHKHHRLFASSDLRIELHENAENK